MSVTDRSRRRVGAATSIGSTSYLVTAFAAPAAAAALIWPLVVVVVALLAALVVDAVGRR